MKKKYDYRSLSNKECDFPGCKKKLKLRLVMNKASHNITHCYRHGLVVKMRKLRRKR
jgi:hypothetical protein